MIIKDVKNISYGRKEVTMEFVGGRIRKAIITYPEFLSGLKFSISSKFGTDCEKHEFYRK